LPYGEVSDQIFTVDGTFSLAWSHYQLRASVTNLLDNKYRLGEYNFASDFKSQPQPTLVPEREFTAGAPRAVFVTFGINFGGA
jgi:outer membrane receptor protein involved in Fe transport